MPRGRPTPPDVKARVIDLYHEGYSIRMIVSLLAKEMGPREGISFCAVRNACKEGSVEFRSNNWKRGT